MIGRDREAEILRLYHAEKWCIGTIAAQLGLHHSTVRRVLAQAGLDSAWVAQQQQNATNPAPGTSAALGKQVFLSAGCVGCHQINGVTPAVAVSLIGPNLVLTAHHCVADPPSQLACGQTFSGTASAMLPR